VVVEATIAFSARVNVAESLQMTRLRGSDKAISRFKVSGIVQG